MRILGRVDFPHCHLLPPNRLGISHPRQPAVDTQLASKNEIPIPHYFVLVQSSQRSEQRITSWKINVEQPCRITPFRGFWSGGCLGPDCSCHSAEAPRPLRRSGRLVVWRLLRARVWRDRGAHPVARALWNQRPWAHAATGPIPRHADRAAVRTGQAAGRWLADRFGPGPLMWASFGLCLGPCGPSSAFRICPAGKRRGS